VAGPSPDILDLVARVTEELRNHIPVTAVVLFGSHLTGETHEGSDIDVAVYTAAARDMTLKERVRLAVIIGEELDWSIELHFFPETAVSERIPVDFGSYVYEHGLRVA
jgi:predicted nucleotidyltransferase